MSVLGCGTMGSGIAYVGLLNGHEVSIFDASASAIEGAVGRIEADLKQAVDRGKITEGSHSTFRRNLVVGASLSAVAETAEVIIEAVTEDYTIKQKLLVAAESAANPRAIIGTNTSSLSVTRIAQVLKDPSRCIGLHFFNPVRAMKLCEIVIALQTSQDTVAAAEDVVRQLGKVPVKVRDSAGFVTSRINAMIGNEAFFLLEEGVASAEEIDLAVKLALNHPMGPFELADVVGLDVRLAVLQELRRSLGPKYRPAPLLEQYVSAGWLGVKTGRGVYEYPRDVESNPNPSR